MSRYKSSGQSLDDVYSEDGDNHFVGVDTRIHPTLLNAGMVQASENFRFDDLTATVRKGIDRISADVITAGSALTLPFGLGGSIPIQSIEYTTEVGEAFVTLASASKPTINAGESMLITGSDRPEFNREYILSKISDTSFSFVPVGGPANGLSDVFIQTSVGPTDGTTNSFDADALLVVGQDYEILDYETGDDFSDVGGPASAPSTTHDGVIFTCTAEKPASYANATRLKRVTMSMSGLLGLVVDGAFATTLFSDVETNKEYVAMATANKVILVDPDNPNSPIDVPYDSGIVIEPSNESDILQVNNGLLIHRGKTEKAIEWDGSVSVTQPTRVSGISLTSNVVTAITLSAHGYHTGDTVIVAGADDSFYNGTFTVSSITSATVFTYAVVNANDTGSGGTITSQKVSVFKEVADTLLSAPEDGGFLSMPQADFSMYHPFARLIVPVRVFELDIDGSLVRSGTTATATTTYNHGLQVNDRITMTGAVGPEYNGIKEITRIDNNEFLADGVTPNPEQGKVFDYVVTGTPTSPDTGAGIVCKVDVRDQFIVSDFFDHRTYDPLNNLFRINRGTADKLVSFLIFQEDNLIALYQKSIHIISGMSTSSLEDSFVRQVTSEVGCIARKTATIVGDKMIFLSEQGVYMLQITPELNLRGVDVPLSFDIQDEFRGLNYDFIDKSVGVYFNNRYYIAVPSSGSERNNVVYVYNFLNKKWESKDTFAGGVNFIDNWVVCQKDGQDRLFGSSVEGALQLWEEKETDELSLTEGADFTEEQILGKLTTRRYIGGNTSTVKKFNRGTINFEVGINDAMTVSATTENPETTVTSLTEVATANEDKHKRFRINKRGTGVQLEVNTTEGRPQIRSFTVGSTETQLANKTFE